MAIPDYQSIMLPLLSFAEDGKEHSLRQSYEPLAEKFHLSAAERKERLPSGQQEIFQNRINWARTYLKMAGLIESKRRGFFNITKRGYDCLAKRPDKIDTHYLSQFPEFHEFRSRKKKLPANISTDLEANPAPDFTETPEEQLETAYQLLRDDLISEILVQLKSCTPLFFEKIVVEVLVNMGYGGSRRDAGQAIGQSGDEGIDGIINEDRLGLDIIYIQAKRWEGTVSRPEIQKFAGALQGRRAKKGIFITTSEFSRNCFDYVSSIDSKIILIDGKHLAELMIDFDVGVTSQASYQIKKIDLDYYT